MLFLDVHLSCTVAPGPHFGTYHRHEMSHGGRIPNCWGSKLWVCEPLHMVFYSIAINCTISTICRPCPLPITYQFRRSTVLVRRQDYLAWCFFYVPYYCTVLYEVRHCRVSRIWAWATANNVCNTGYRIILFLTGVRSVIKHGTRITNHSLHLFCLEGCRNFGTSSTCQGDDTNID